MDANMSRSSSPEMARNGGKLVQLACIANRPPRKKNGFAGRIVCLAPPLRFLRFVVAHSMVIAVD